MVAILILTRAVVISALAFGAYAAPLLSAAHPADVAVGNPDALEPRFCRQMGCLFEVPTDTEPTDGKLVDFDSDGKEAVFAVEKSNDAEPPAVASEDTQGSVGDVSEATIV
ncbi:hypothetical protein C8Q77DRAFT_288343 [Trametes polyzona]|nr:hypothetical protein C8Q77DRAFT_288343 [Trametes polyzona]